MENNMISMYGELINRIVNKNGGWREKDILSRPYDVEKETWNKEHKVLNIIAVETEQDGYRSGFQIDLVTKSICG